MKNKYRSIFSNAVIVSAFVIFTKILGLVKQVLLAYKFGASVHTDAYFISTGLIISSCTVIFGAIALSILPIYNDKIQISREKAVDFINNILFVNFLFSLLLSLLFFIFSDQISLLLSSSDNKELLNNISSNIRMISVVVFISSYYYTLNVVLEARGVFLPGKLYTFFQNSFLLIAIWFFSEKYGFNSLIYAFIIASLAQAIFITVKAFRYHKIRIRPLRIINDIKMVLPFVVPLIIGNGIYQINDIVDKNISSSLGNGYASYLNYGQSINEIITVVIVGVISTIIFSRFSSQISAGNLSYVNNLYDKTIGFLTVVLSFIALITIIYSKEIVQLFYFRGSFEYTDIKNTQLVLISYSVGFVFVAFRSITSRLLFAHKNSKTPMINGVISVMLNIVLTIILTRYVNILGVGLATSISMIFSSVFFIASMRKNYKHNYSPILHTLFQSIVSISLSVIVHFLLKNIFDNYYISLFVSAIGASLTYFLSLVLLRNNEMISIINYIKKHIIKIDTI
jgi:murein biosynthesis integral membrane protein MurJ